MESGKIKWFDRQKGFGYIIQDNGGPDIYVHIKSVISKSLKDKDRVWYLIGENDRGPCAIDVSNEKKNSITPTQSKE